MSKETKKYTVTTGNIFADLGLDKPDELLAKAKLMHEVGTLIKKSKLSQKEVAKKLNITQPKVSLLLSGKLSQFSSETLMHYLYILGCDVKIRIKKPSSKSWIFKRKGRIAVC